MRTTGWTAEEMVNITAGRPALLTTSRSVNYRGRRYLKSQNAIGLFTLAFNNLDNMSPELRLTLKHYGRCSGWRNNAAMEHHNNPRRSQSRCGRARPMRYVGSLRRAD